MLLALVPIVVALIAAAVSLVQLAATRRNAREIEALKSRLHEEEERRSEYFRRYLESVTQGHERELAAFRDLLAAGQRLRDKLKIIAEYSDTLDPTLLGKEMAALASDVISAYAANQLHLSEQDRAIAHEFKSLSSAIAARIATKAARLTRASTAAVEEQASLAASHARLRQAALEAAGRYNERLRLKAEGNDA